MIFNQAIFFPDSLLIARDPPSFLSSTTSNLFANTLFMAQPSVHHLRDRSSDSLSTLARRRIIIRPRLDEMHLFVLED